MKKKLFWLPCLMFLLGAVCVSCGNDNNDPTDNPDGGDDTEVKSDYTATANVKTVTLKSGTDVIVIYEDFNRKYSLYINSGQLKLLSYIRTSGSWGGNRNSLSYSSLEAGMYMKDIGKVSGLSAITKKVKIGNSSPYYPNFQPQHGYATVFTTENDELKYLRIFTSAYTLNSKGSIATGTLQYQLY